MKYYKIVYGYNESDYFPITSDELHKAMYLSMKGGKALFEAGFFQNRGNDIMRIVPDWHRVRGWNKGWKMTNDDYADISSLEEDYQKTLNNGKILTEYIVSSNELHLLNLPASKAFSEIKRLTDNKVHKFLHEKNNR